MSKFWSKVRIGSPDDCWEWKGSLHKLGYGQYRVAGNKYQAHRYAWILEHGRIPENMCVLHKCDNRGCVNPAHLFIGTQQDNIADMVAKGRQRSAVGNKHTAKVTQEQVRIIRYWWSLGNMTQQRIGDYFGIKQPAVHAIVHNINWKRSMTNA